jgi:penicillin-binding protein 1C
MEINLTALWDTLTSPFRWVGRKVGQGFNKVTGRSSSRLHRLTPAEKKLRFFRWGRFLALSGLACAVLGVIVFFAMFAYYSKDLPEPGQIVRRDGFSTRIYDRNGSLLYDLFDSERRTPVTIDQIPDVLKQATVAVEDKDFYKHGGFDNLTIVRIPYNLIFRQRVVGGSTLTQQLVKNVFLTNERSIIRKFKEFVLSLQIERKFTKDQILEMYLNEAPYGGTAWGVGTASEIYFNKPVSQITLVEASILAGLPQRPSVYSPYSGKTDPETGDLWWKVRARGVLRRMREDNYLTDLTYQQALADLETVSFQRAPTAIKAPHFVFYVRDQLVEMYGEEFTERGGLKVTTSLDLPLQEAAQKIVSDEVTKVEQFHITNGAAMVTNPTNGEILSMVGSRDYFSDTIDGQFNVAVDGLRQPGSSIKPLTYLALFQRGYTPASMLADVETVFKPNETAKEYKPKNYDGKFRGPVSLRTSLGSSLNIPAVKGVAIVGVDTFMKLAYDMGFPTLEPTPENLRRVGFSVTLGGGEVHLLDTVTAYSAFANGGYKVEPVAILKVEDRNGKVIYEHKPVQGRQVIKPEEAFLINNVLSDNEARTPAFGPSSLLNTGKAVAVKTGTTNDQKDNWTIGWSQKLMVGTWVGNNDSTPMTRVASGVTGASPIWRQILEHALKNGYEAPQWVVPAGVEQVEVDAISGYPKHDDFAGKMDWVIKGTLPALPDPIHTKLKLCRGENKLANEARIATGDYDEKEFVVMRENDPVSADGVNRWQQSIDAWVNAQTDGKYKAPTESCGDQSETSVRLVKPENEHKYDSEDIEIEIQAASGDGIEKIELWIDGAVKETINSYQYKGTVKLGAGQHEIWAKAKSRTGKEVESNHAKIGTGGQDWKKPDPTPTPTPIPTATPAPTAAPTLLPTPPGGP